MYLVPGGWGGQVLLSLWVQGVVSSGHLDHDGDQAVLRLQGGSHPQALVVVPQLSVGACEQPHGHFSRGVPHCQKYTVHIFYIKNLQARQLYSRPNKRNGRNLRQRKTKNPLFCFQHISSGLDPRTSGGWVESNQQVWSSFNHIVQLPETQLGEQETAEWVVRIT